MKVVQLGREGVISTLGQKPGALKYLCHTDGFERTAHPLDLGDLCFRIRGRIPGNSLIFRSFLTSDQVQSTS